MFWNRSSSLGSLFRDMQRMQREMDRWFANGSGPLAASTVTSFPALNLWEEDNQFFLEAELPGYEIKDIELVMHGQDQLTIKGQRQAPTLEKAVCHRQERPFGQFQRTLRLPASIDPNQIEAKLENGMLKIQLMKSESARAKKIPVMAG